MENIVVKGLLTTDEAPENKCSLCGIVTKCLCTHDYLHHPFPDIKEHPKRESRKKSEPEEVVISSKQKYSFLDIGSLRQRE